MPHTLSLAWRLGRAVAAAQHAKLDPVAALVAEAGGRLLFTGTVLSCWEPLFSRQALGWSSWTHPSPYAASENGLQME